ncbi:MAG: InlB B-repeat-containing protein, partial [Clostridia bacterium]|nr:InlB B-repeat-containing protein [Clostridia bacterium]
MAEKEKTTSFTLTMLVDGEVWESQTVEKGKRLSSMPKPTKEHHTFSGWDKVPSRMPARDLTVEGHFVPNTYKLSFCVGEETLCTLELAYGAPVECPEAPEREGHTFVGWQNLPETMPGEDTIVEGVFQPQTYQITYVIRNAENKAATTSFTYPCVFGAPIPPMDLPQKDYYTFSGWENLPETMPA